MTTDVTSPEGLAHQAELLARVRALRARRDKLIAEANVELREAIKDALDAGARPKDVALASGFSRQHVDNIRNQ